MAGRGGLFRFDAENGVFSRVESAAEPRPRSVWGLFSDRSGRLWATCETEGLWEHDPLSGEWRNYDVRDGLGDNRTVDVIGLPSGELVVTSLGGINLFDPAQLAYAQDPPRVRFTDFLLHNNPVRVSREGRETPLSSSRDATAG